MLCLFADRNSEIEHHLNLIKNSKKRNDILETRKAILKLVRTDENIEKAARNRECE